MASYKEQSAFCPNCQRRVLARREDVPHTFWLIASLFSCGLFAIIWGIITITNSSKPFLCSNCGSITGQNPQTLSNGNTIQLSSGGSSFMPSKQLSTGAKLAIGVFALFLGIPFLITFISAFTSSEKKISTPPVSLSSIVSNSDNYAQLNNANNSTKKKQSSAPKLAWQIGNRVLARWNADSYFYSGRIGQIEGSKYYIVFDDGDFQWTDVSNIKGDNITVGSRVFGNWKKQGVYYPGRVTARNGNDISIHYDDGDEETASISIIRTR